MEIRLNAVYMESECRGNILMESLLRLDESKGGGCVYLLTVEKISIARDGGKQASLARCSNRSPMNNVTPRIKFH